MILIACADDNLGMLFNARRQSMDRVLRSRLLERCKGCNLWMNAYSRGQFDETAEGITVDEDFMAKAGCDDYCFAENISVKPYEKEMQKIIFNIGCKPCFKRLRAKRQQCRRTGRQFR